MESVALSVNYLPLLLIFFVILVCKLLRSVLYTLTSWVRPPREKFGRPELNFQVVRGVTSSPCGVDRIRNEISDLKREIGDISTTVHTHTCTHTHTDHLCVYRRILLLIPD